MYGLKMVEFDRGLMKGEEGWMDRAHMTLLRTKANLRRMGKGKLCMLIQRDMKDLAEKDER